MLHIYILNIYMLHVYIVVEVSDKRPYVFFRLRQTDDCTVDSPLWITFPNIYLTKLEEDQVRLLKHKFYRRFVEDLKSRRLKNMHDSSFENLNNYKKIKFTIEANPKKFLDTRFLLENDIIKMEGYHKASKFPIHWKSQIPKRYKKCNKWRPILFMENQLKFLS